MELRDRPVLTSGAVVPNRIAKVATEENLAAEGQVPDDDLVEVYRRWAAPG